MTDAGEGLAENFLNQDHLYKARHRQYPQIPHYLGGDGDDVHEKHINPEVSFIMKDRTR
jgi:hypothetical protein